MIARAAATLSDLLDALIAAVTGPRQPDPVPVPVRVRPTDRR